MLLYKQEFCRQEIGGYTLKVMCPSAELKGNGVGVMVSYKCSLNTV